MGHIKGDELESLGLDLADHSRVAELASGDATRMSSVREGTALLRFRRSISVVLSERPRHSVPASWNVRKCCRPMQVSGLPNTVRNRS